MSSPAPAVPRAPRARSWARRLRSRALLVAAVCSGAHASAAAKPPERAAAAERPAAAADGARTVKVDAGLDGVSVERGDGAFGIKLDALVRVRHVGSFGADAPSRSEFSVPMARPALHAHLWGDRARVFLQAELAGEARLLDAKLTLKLVDGLWLETGQMMVPFTRAFLTPVPKVQLPDFGLVNDAFRVGRDIGVALHGEPRRGLLELTFGVYSGDPFKLAERPNPSPMVLARVVVNPLGRVDYSQTSSLDGDRPLRVALGANAYTHVATAPAEGDGPEGLERLVTAGGDLALEGWRANLLVEGFWRRAWARAPIVETRDSWGVYAQPGVFVWARHLGSSRASGSSTSRSSAASAPTRAGSTATCSAITSSCSCATAARGRRAAPVGTR